MSALRQLTDAGQSVWLDFIRRSSTRDGELARLVTDDGLRGVTSNPSIFQKAIADSQDYRRPIATLSEDKSLSAKDIYERLAIEDIQEAADVLATVYERTERLDGYVSLEVSPELGRDTEGTIAEARRLWRTVARPNLMIKVPGTAEGLPAIETLLGDGINVNVTLIFAQQTYDQVAQAHLRGLEAFKTRGGEVGKVASVASFFVSRIDTEIDGRLAKALETTTDPEQRSRLSSLVGKVAIANARLAYRHYQQLMASTRWKALAADGAMPQRLLWASTSTKNPDYRDVIYVEELIGTETVNTMPPATFDAFKNHGNVRPSLTEDLVAAKSVMANLELAGISMTEVTDQLLEEGLDKFSTAFRGLLDTVEQQRK